MATADPDRLPDSRPARALGEVWGNELEDGSVESAANLMMAIVYIHLMDLTAPPLEHVKAAV